MGTAVAVGTMLPINYQLLIATIAIVASVAAARKGEIDLRIFRDNG